MSGRIWLYNEGSQVQITVCRVISPFLLKYQRSLWKKFATNFSCHCLSRCFCFGKECQKCLVQSFKIQPRSRWTSLRYQTSGYPYRRTCKSSCLKGVCRPVRPFSRQRRFCVTNSKNSRGLGWLLLLCSRASIKFCASCGSNQIALSFGTCHWCCWKRKSLAHALASLSVTDWWIFWSFCFKFDFLT